MTRDEAVKKIVEPYVEIPFGGALVDSLVALGILKLDESRSMESRFYDAIANIDLAHRSSGQLLCALNAAGLRIVEK